MKNTLKSGLTVAILFMVACISFGQKFGHINSQSLLLESPLIKTADAKILDYQSELEKEGVALRGKFDADYEKYLADREAGLLNQVQMQQREAGLQATQESMQKFLQEAQQKMALKREELYAPILDKVKVVIDEIGAEGNYTMIFDTSTNGLLFAMEAEDLMDKVRTKLGW